MWEHVDILQRAEASSTRKPQKGISYDAHNINYNSTHSARSEAWSEGVPGEGVGEWVEIACNMYRADDYDSRVIRRLWRTDMTD